MTITESKQLVQICIQSSENPPVKTVNQQEFSLINGKLQTKPPRPEIQEALAAAWTEIEQGAQRRMQENKEKLQEIYQQEHKPTFGGTHRAADG